MGCALQDPLLRLERDSLHQALYAPCLDPGDREYTPPGWNWDAVGECSIRMLLTALSHWRGAGAHRHPSGIWPHLQALQSGHRFLLGPVPSAQHQLLTDAQLIRLLCEGCPFARPTARRARVDLHSIELDRHDSAARMRAILCASIFCEWREAEYVRTRQPGYVPTARTFPFLQPGDGCRLAQTRATMGRLIAGLSVRMFRQDLRDEQGTDALVTYQPAAIPPGGFVTAAPPAEQDPTGSGRAGGAPTAPTTRAPAAPRARSAPAADGDGGGDGPRRSGRRPPPP
jgi:hypothetical protein